jgi:hypothetical protein
MPFKTALTTFLITLAAATATAATPAEAPQSIQTYLLRLAKVM